MKKEEIKSFIENQLKKGEDVLFNFYDCLDNDKDFNYNKNELEEYIKDLYSEELKDFYKESKGGKNKDGNSNSRFK